MAKKKILYLYEKNKKSGFGHFYRSKNYFEYLRNFFNITFSNFNNFSYLNKKQNFDLYIFDLKKYELKFFKRNKLFDKSITFDNFNNICSIINISIFDHNPRIGGNRLKGNKFVYINPKKFLQFKKKNDKKKQIFISIGSEDKKNLLPRIINKLKKEKINYDFKIHLPTIKKKINKTNQVKYLKDFIESEYCIVNGGMTMIEAIFLKKRCIIIPQTKYEKKFAEYLKKEKIINHIGLHEIKKLNYSKKTTKRRKKLSFENRGNYHFKKVINSILTKNSIMRKNVS